VRSIKFLTAGDHRLAIFCVLTLPLMQNGPAPHDVFTNAKAILLSEIKSMGVDKAERWGKALADLLRLDAT
jgi:hypothetical protein